MILWGLMLAGVTDAIIGGGAVRDYILGREPRDIDIFVPASIYPNLAGFESLGDARQAEYLAHKQIQIVTRGKAGAFTADLVGIDPWPATVEGLLETFDFGITRAGFSLDQQLVRMAEFDRDIENRTVSMLLADREGRSLQRFERFNARMGGEYRLC